MWRRRFATSAAATTVATVSRFKPVIGLEIHVQLNTRTKLFSRCPTSDASPNRRVAPFDMATPGTLPALNHQCVHRALKMSRLLKCHVPKWSRFDRKHYFYADMPAGYQITQNEYPIARDGLFGYWVFGEEKDTPYWKEVEIVQLQLEQDSGKTINILDSSPSESSESRSLIDYNRAGCALIEIVTSPCFETAIEAIRFVQTLRLLIIHHNLSDGELHRGHLRVDANVSLTVDGKPGTRTEIKNMNSIRTIHTAINFEIARQFEILSNSSGKVIRETRGVDSEGRTVPMREKDAEDTDYRFMVEPNLPILKIRKEWMEGAERELETQGIADFEWLRDRCGFDPRSAIHIAEEPDLLAFVKRCVRFKDSEVTADEILYWMRELKTIMQRSKGNYPPKSDFFAKQFTTLIHHSGRLTRLRLLDLLRFYATSSESEDVLEEVTEFIDKNDFWRISDTEKIDKFVEESMTKNGKLAEKVRSGHAKSFNKMRNLMIETSEKRIELEDAEDAIRRFLQK
ncbi:hypothetical protein GCK72_011494 [Caenorhabditis remanei]|uniref:Glutamyl-tRNA(Gln) amidotransferase subunit B, mitochondrial n=1 Tax=Caenorhabditis remanei TaxID=31234 RepID=A0A6A5H663_CAERE|nr:hypothetical protein GCK72_011494 [Caenorhabditis remanei]KAF1763228.1 hypothetical protein GCK72_011494 [Caenorhabditis remanei]